jgi:hypothetical protein
MHKGTIAALSAVALLLGITAVGRIFIGTMWLLGVTGVIDEGAESTIGVAEVAAVLGAGICCGLLAAGALKLASIMNARGDEAAGA